MHGLLALPRFTTPGHPEGRVWVAVRVHGDRDPASAGIARTCSATSPTSSCNQRSGRPISAFVASRMSRSRAAAPGTPRDGRGHVRHGVAGHDHVAHLAVVAQVFEHRSHGTGLGQRRAVDDRRPSELLHIYRPRAEGTVVFLIRARSRIAFDLHLWDAAVDPRHYGHFARLLRAAVLGGTDDRRLVSLQPATTLADASARVDSATGLGA